MQQSTSQSRRLRAGSDRRVDELVAVGAAAVEYGRLRLTRHLEVRPPEAISSARCCCGSRTRQGATQLAGRHPVRRAPPSLHAGRISGSESPGCTSGRPQLQAASGLPAQLALRMGAVQAVAPSKRRCWGLQHGPPRSGRCGLPLRCPPDRGAGPRSSGPHPQMLPCHPPARFPAGADCFVNMEGDPSQPARYQLQLHSPSLAGCLMFIW